MSTMIEKYKLYIIEDKSGLCLKNLFFTIIICKKRHVFHRFLIGTHTHTHTHTSNKHTYTHLYLCTCAYSYTNIHTADTVTYTQTQR